MSTTKSVEDHLSVIYTALRPTTNSWRVKQILDRNPHMINSNNKLPDSYGVGLACKKILSIQHEYADRSN